MDTILIVIIIMDTILIKIIIVDTIFIVIIINLLSQRPPCLHFQDKDQKTVCIMNKSGVFELKTGFIGGCGSGCCLFFGPGQETAGGNAL